MTAKSSRAPHATRTDIEGIPIGVMGLSQRRPRERQIAGIVDFVSRHAGTANATARGFAAKSGLTENTCLSRFTAAERVGRIEKDPAAPGCWRLPAGGTT